MQSQFPVLSFLFLLSFVKLISNAYCQVLVQLMKEKLWFFKIIFFPAYCNIAWASNNFRIFEQKKYFILAIVDHHCTEVVCHFLEDLQSSKCNFLRIIKTYSFFRLKNWIGTCKLFHFNLFYLAFGCDQTLLNKNQMIIWFLNNQKED